MREFGRTTWTSDPGLKNDIKFYGRNGGNDDAVTQSTEEESKTGN